LQDRLVKLEIVESVSHETIRTTAVPLFQEHWREIHRFDSLEKLE
jgi:hypothetical protein